MKQGRPPYPHASKSLLSKDLVACFQYKADEQKSNFSNSTFPGKNAATGRNLNSNTMLLQFVPELGPETVASHSQAKGLLALSDVLKAEGTDTPLSLYSKVMTPNDSRASVKELFAQNVDSGHARKLSANTSITFGSKEKVDQSSQVTFAETFMYTTKKLNYGLSNVLMPSADPPYVDEEAAATLELFRKGIFKTHRKRRNRDEALKLSKGPSLPPKERFCSCVSSKCLKLYCACFKSGKACAQSCQCTGCKNIDVGFEPKREIALLENSPEASKSLERCAQLNPMCPGGNKGQNRELRVPEEKGSRACSDGVHESKVSAQPRAYRKRQKRARRRNSIQKS